MIPALTLVVASALSCPDIKVINQTKEWTEKDQQSLSTASRRCGEMYLDSPCLKLFKKVEDGVYMAICGAVKPIEKQPEK